MPASTLTDGFLERLPSGGNLYYKGLSLQKVIPFWVFFGGGVVRASYIQKNFKSYLCKAKIKLFLIYNSFIKHIQGISFFCCCYIKHLPSTLYMRA